MNEKKLYPLKFKPILKERIWGGVGLQRAMNKQLPEGAKIGESWELSGVEGDLSVVAEGFLKGNNIEELIEVYMGDLVGDKVFERYGTLLPLFFKLIDAQDVLSIQVHPNDELAKERHNSLGKSEMWYVVDREPGASIYVGFNKELTKQEYMAAVESGTVEELMQEVKVEPGDAFMIPAGLVHALGRGVLVAEIQQTSDITYRIFDWNRVDDSGEPRELHTQLAMDAINFGESPKQAKRAEPNENESQLVVESEYFTVNVVRVNGEISRDYSKLDSFVVYMCTEGEMVIKSSSGEVAMVKGDTIMVPATEDSVRLRGEGKLLECYIK